MKLDTDGSKLVQGASDRYWAGLQVVVRFLLGRSVDGMEVEFGGGYENNDLTSIPHGGNVVVFFRWSRKI